MDKPQIVNALNGHDAFRNVKPRDVLVERVVFNQERHHIATLKSTRHQ
jgi:hypothetical protein